MQTQVTEVATITEDQLRKLEDQVRRGSAAFIAVGQALTKIREGKGYRLRGFETFEIYCDQVFGFTDRQGRRLIQAAETAAAVKAATGETPANESVAREFTSIANDPVKLKKVVDQVERRGYTVVTATADAVKEAVQRLAPKPKPVLATPTGKAVVLPGNGNGHRSAPALAPSISSSPSEPTGACPHCGERPDSWIQSEEVWECAECHKMVLLQAIQWPPEAAPKNGKNGSAQGVPLCPHCRKPINPGEVFCNNCGAAL